MQPQDNWNNPALDSAGKSPIVPPDDDAQQMPLNMLTGGGETFEADLLGESSLDSGSKGIPGMVLVLIIILAVGGGALWAMRMTGSSAAPEDKEVASASTKIDEALKELAAGESSARLSQQSVEAIFEDPDQVVALFANDPVKSQVALEDLSKNPFKMLLSNKVDQDDVPAAAVDFQRQERLRRLETELNNLKLQSLLTGARSLAVVSGKVVRVGDSVGSFAVQAITDDGVKLSAEGETFQLSIPPPSARGK